MARRCDITGKSTRSGHHVSHSNRKVNRTFKPNVHKKTYMVPGEKEGSIVKVKLKLSRKAIRLIDKLGIEKVLEKFATN